MIKVRIIADDVDDLDQAALAVGQVLTITRESRPRPRRSDDGVTLYLDAELPPDTSTVRPPTRGDHL